MLELCKPFLDRSHRWIPDGLKGDRRLSFYTYGTGNWCERQFMSKDRGPFLFQHNSPQQRKTFPNKVAQCIDLIVKSAAGSGNGAWNDVELRLSGNEAISSWKIWGGRAKEWRRCLILKLTSSLSFSINLFTGNMQGPTQWRAAGAQVPTAMLRQNATFKRAHALRHKMLEKHQKQRYSKGLRRETVLLDTDSLDNEAE